MAVLLEDADGVFKRLGVLEDLRQKVKLHQDLIDTEIDDILDEYNNDRDFAASLQPSLDAMKRSAAAPQVILREIAKKTLLESVYADNPLITRTSVSTALIELIDQMVGTSDSLDGNVVAAGAPSYDGDNTGNAIVVTDVTDTEAPPNGGYTLQHLRAEDITLVCVRDAQVSGTSGKTERWSVSGELAIPDISDQNWPGGSGINTSLQVLSSDEDARASTGRTILTNGNFEDFATANNPDNWVEVVGSFGTQILEEGTLIHRGSKALEIVGDAGGTLTEMKQTLNTSGQTVGRLLPKTKYVLAVAIRKSAGLVAGTLVISVRDTSDDSLVAAAATISKAFGDITTSYVIYTATFNTPLVLPSTAKIDILLTVAATDGESFYIDDLVLAPMVQMGPGDGPYMAVVPGATPSILKDKATVAIANGGEGELMDACDRWFGLYNLGLRPQMPFNLAGAETIADTLIA